MRDELLEDMQPYASERLRIFVSEELERYVEMFDSLLVFAETKKGLTDLALQRGAFCAVPAVAERPRVALHRFRVMLQSFHVGRHPRGLISGSQQVTLR